MADSDNLSQLIYRDSQGREFNYIHVDRGNERLGVHFSAFFGDWGDKPKYRNTFGGYFHRLRMLSSDESIDWLFLCDTYGADQNGSYYIGKENDRFVEAGILEILKLTGLGTRYSTNHTVTIGSSMGATAAIKFGLMYRVKGVIAISPHIDLDTSALLQNRERHVSWILNNADSQDRANYPITRQIRLQINEYALTGNSLPVLFVQSCRDDHGVHFEQVVPLVEQWRKNGGVAWFDDRKVGGHTSKYATRALLLDVVNRLLDNERLILKSYKWNHAFRPYGYTKAIASNITLRLSHYGNVSSIYIKKSKRFVAIRSRVK